MLRRLLIMNILPLELMFLWIFSSSSSINSSSSHLKMAISKLSRYSSMFFASFSINLTFSLLPFCFKFSFVKSIEIGLLSMAMTSFARFENSAVSSPIPQLISKTTSSSVTLDLYNSMARASSFTNPETSQLCIKSKSFIILSLEFFSKFKSSDSILFSIFETFRCLCLKHPISFQQ